jgi:hypothetical protein
VHAAALAAGIDKRVSMHTFRHSFATHLLEQKVDIRVIQVLLGHTKIETTTLYAQVATDLLREVISPLVILPGFYVHQDFDNVLMNGERDEKGNGIESAIHGRVQARSVAIGGIGRRQPGGEAIGDSGIESRQLAPTQAQREIDSGSASDGNQALAGGAGGGEPSVAARAGQYQA